MKRPLQVLLVLAAVGMLDAGAANERFASDKGPLHGFLPATDPAYVKECGACHFPYSPGLLPARSWERQFSRLDKHFGESIRLDDATRAQLLRYLTQNAADVSRYEGSLTFMEEITPAMQPYRLQDVPLFRQMHRIVLAVIDTKPKIKVKKLTNCNDCHQRAAEGSFGLDELVIPGITPTRRDK